MNLSFRNRRSCAVVNNLHMPKLATMQQLSEFLGDSEGVLKHTLPNGRVLTLKVRPSLCRAH